MTTLPRLLVGARRAAGRNIVAFRSILQGERDPHPRHRQPDVFHQRRGEVPRPRELDPPEAPPEDDGSSASQIPADGPRVSDQAGRYRVGRPRSAL